LQQVRINKHAQLCAVTKGRHAAIGLSNPRARLVTSNPSSVRLTMTAAKHLREDQTRPSMV
jgi:hypothetical protein